jgi:hypothetical protein
MATLKSALIGWVVNFLIEVAQGRAREISRKKMRDVREDKHGSALASYPHACMYQGC